MKNNQSLVREDYPKTDNQKILSIAVIIAAICFLLAICLGILYLGKTNFESIFYIILSCYAALFGFLMAAYLRRKDTSKSEENVLMSLVATQIDKGIIVFNQETGKISYNNDKALNVLGFEPVTLSDLCTNAEIHPLDRSQLQELLLFKENDQFLFPIRRQQRNGVLQWITFKSNLVQKAQNSLIILFIDDQTEAKQTQSLQSKYIQEMEYNIQQNQFQNDRMRQLAQLISTNELQEPLHTIKHYIQLIETQYKSAPQKTTENFEEYLGQGTWHINHLINNMLANTELDEENTSMEVINTNQLLADIIDKMNMRLRSANAQIHYRSLPNIYVDKKQIEHLFFNMIENAIKYRGDRPLEIFIDCNKEKEEWVFSIEDNGKGIERSHQEEIFKFFNRGQIKNGYKGLGMGLAVCKKIIDNHCGHIWVESLGKEQGSTFYFALPSKENEILEVKREKIDTTNEYVVARVAR